jgi:hypothetical protein
MHSWKPTGGNTVNEHSSGSAPSLKRVGYLVKRHLLGAYESILLDNLASSAIEVSIKIEPLVLDARQTVNAKLFQDFQEMIPEATGTMCPGEPSVPEGGKKRQGLS